MSSLRHEPDAPPMRALLHVLLAICGGFALSLLVALWVWRGLFSTEAALPPPAAAVPPPPRLQAQPQPDREAFEAAQRQRLERYAWIDRERRIARIPVDAAMRALRTEQAP